MSPQRPQKRCTCPLLYSWVMTKGMPLRQICQSYGRQLSLQVCERMMPGYGEQMRAISLKWVLQAAWACPRCMLGVIPCGT